MIAKTGLCFLGTRLVDWCPIHQPAGLLLASSFCHSAVAGGETGGWCPGLQQVLTPFQGERFGCLNLTLGDTVVKHLSPLLGFEVLELLCYWILLWLFIGALWQDLNSESMANLKLVNNLTASTSQMIELQSWATTPSSHLLNLNYYILNNYTLFAVHWSCLIII